jgi:hypothetical protein
VRIFLAASVRMSRIFLTRASRQADAAYRISHLVAEGVDGGLDVARASWPPARVAGPWPCAAYDVPAGVAVARACLAAALSSSRRFARAAVDPLAHLLGKLAHRVVEILLEVGEVELPCGDLASARIGDPVGPLRPSSVRSTRPSSSSLASRGYTVPALGE